MAGTTQALIVPGERKQPNQDFLRLALYNEDGSPFVGGGIGPRGPQGYQGPKGDKGDKGDTGSRGDLGPKGDRGGEGPQGEQGERGAQGIPGPQGVAGPAGPAGPQGQSGIIGSIGPQGPQGVQGPQGDKGDPGSVPTLNWVAYPLANGWRDHSVAFPGDGFGPPQYAISGDRVYMRGGLNGGNATGTLAALPAAARPQYKQRLILNNGNTFLSADMHPDGIIKTSGGAGLNSVVTSLLPLTNVVYWLG